MNRDVKLLGEGILLFLELLLLDAGVVLLDAQNGLGSLLGGKKMSIERAIWE